MPAVQWALRDEVASPHSGMAGLGPLGRPDQAVEGVSPGGPLAGVTIIELAGTGALPFGTGKLGDMGADVIRVHRTSEVPNNPQPARYSEYNRGRRSIAVDLKQPEGVEVVRRLAETADAFAESFRPGTTERLGVGPDDLWARNSKLVYARLPGW